MGIYPDSNVDLGPKSLNENEFYGDHYNGFAIPSIETITKGGRTVKYELPNSTLNSDGPMEWQLSSAGEGTIMTFSRHRWDVGKLVLAELSLQSTPLSVLACEKKIRSYQSARRLSLR